MHLKFLFFLHLDLFLFFRLHLKFFFFLHLDFLFFRDILPLNGSFAAGRAHGSLGNLVGFFFVGVARRIDHHPAAACRSAQVHPSFALLDDMGQFVGNQFLPTAAAGLILTFFKEDILPGSEGPGVQVLI